MKTLITILITIFCLLNNASANEKPLRLIALAPIITSDLILLGLEENISGNTTYCINSENYTPIKVGNVSNFSTEKIISLYPDIVFCGELGNREKIEKLKSMGIKTVFLPYPKTFSQMCDNLLKIATNTNKTEKAEQLIKTAQKTITELKVPISQKAPKVFVQIGADPLFTANKDSFIHQLIEFAGGINICKDSTTGMYSKEAVIAADPDIILISEMGINGQKEKEKWSTYTSLSAVKNNNIHIIDEYMLCSPSIIKFPKTLQKIKEIINQNNK